MSEQCVPDVELSPLSSPHPDSFVLALTRQLRNCLKLFTAENGSAASLSAVAEIFKSVSSALNFAAPPPGQHGFRVGQRGILQGLKQLPELNGRIVVVKAAADVKEGDGRLEVYLASGSRKDTIRIKPANLRFEQHVMAEAHAASLGHLVNVTSRNDVFQGAACRVIAFDPASRMVTVRTATHEQHAAIVAQYAAKPTPRPVLNPNIFNALNTTEGGVSSPSDSDEEQKRFHAELWRNTLTLEILEHLELQDKVPTFVKARISDAILVDLTMEHLEKLGLVKGQAISFIHEVVALHAPPSITANVMVSEIVPAAYFNLAKEAHNAAMKFILKAQGASATSTVTVVLNAVLSAASFNVRAAADAIASRMICTVMKLLHTSPSSLPLKDSLERRTWTHSFMLTCSMTIEKELCAQDYHQAALNVANQCKQVIEDTLGRDNIVYATLLGNVAKYLGYLQKLEESEAIYKEAIHLIGQNTGTESVQVATSMVSLAGLYKTWGRLDDAEKEYLESIRIIELNAGLEAADAYYPLNNLAAVYEKQNRLDDAEAMFKRALEIKSRNAETDSLDVACTMHNLSLLHMKQNRPNDAEAALKEALRIQELKRGHDVEAVARALNSLGSLYETQGLLHSAEPMYKEALRIFELRLGHESIEVSTTLGYIGMLCKKQNRLEDAEAALQEALGVISRGLGAEHVQSARSMCNLASVILALGKEDEAERMYKISLAIKEKHSGLDAMERADTMSDLAALYQAQGRLSEAETMLTEALRINQLLLGQESPAVEELMNRMAGLYPPPLSPIPDCGA